MNGEDNIYNAKIHQKVMSERYDPLTTQEWIKHLRYQADETKEHRHYLYEKVELKTKRRILDVGCGPGFITADIASLTGGRITGIDIDEKKLEHAKTLVRCNRITFAKADALHLPFKDETFDLVVFSFVLMHIREQQKAVNEMVRVTQKNGIVLATMEPDNVAAISYPQDEMLPLFLKDLRDMGSDARTGRKLQFLFRKAGLNPEVGISTRSSTMNKDATVVLENFLNRFWVSEKLFRKNGWTDSQIEDYKQRQIELIKNRLFISFIPVFYAIGRKE